MINQRKKGMVLGLALILLALFLWAASSTFLQNPEQTSGNASIVGTATPVPQNPNLSPQQQAIDSLTSDLKGKIIAEQKDELARQYANVTPGTHSEEAFIEHCIAVMKLLGLGTSRCLPQTPQPPPPSFFTPLPTVPIPIVSSVDITTAWGTQLNVNKIPVGVGDKYVMYPQAVTPDVKFMLGSLLTRDFGEHGGTEPGKAVLIDIGSGQMTEIHSFASKRSAMYFADADDKWMVWTEGDDGGGPDAWALYSYNFATRLVKQIVTPPVDKNGRLLSGPSGLRVDHGLAVWRQNASPTGSPIQSIIQSADLATGEIKTLSDNGLDPAISWPYVGWLETEQERSKYVESMMKRVIVVLNLQTGVKKTLSQPDTPLLFDLYKDSIVWISGNGRDVILTDIDETYQQIIARGGAGYFGTFTAPSINDRLVVWQSNEQPQVWDRLQKRLVFMDSDYGEFNYVSGDAFVWTTWNRSTPSGLPDKQLDYGIINIIDSRKLPNP